MIGHAGGGVLYSEATDALRRFVDQSGIPVGETMAGKGSMRYDHPLNLAAVVPLAHLRRTCMLTTPI